MWSGRRTRKRYRRAVCRDRVAFGRARCCHPERAERVEGSALLALCVGLRVRAVASIHGGGKPRLDDTAVQPRTPLSRTRAPAAPFLAGARSRSFALWPCAPGTVWLPPLSWIKKRRPFSSRAR